MKLYGVPVLRGVRILTYLQAYVLVCWMCIAWVCDTMFLVQGLASVGVRESETRSYVTCSDIYDDMSVKIVLSSL